MDIYWVERDGHEDQFLKKRVSELEAAGFNGVMYPYGPTMGDYFTRVSRMINPESNFKYIVSIRTYNLSAQYLSMLCSSINKISPNKVGVNLLTGYINKEERAFGGVMSEINDYSSNIDRSNYMLEYAKEFRRIGSAPFFVSTTNQVVFEACTENSLPILIPYLRYKADWFKMSGQKVMLMIAPVIGTADQELNYECDNDNECRHPKGAKCMDIDFFTEETFFQFLDQCEADGVNSILFQESDYSEEQYNSILSSIIKYKARKSEA